MNKKELRKQFKTIRDHLTDRDIKDDLIFKQLCSDDHFITSQHIGIYSSFSSEVNTNKIIEYCLIMNKHVYLPKIIDNQKMIFIEINTNSKYEMNKYHILEPVGIKVEPTIIQCMICPGLVFDHTYNRIGYGKGYYDSYLKELECYKIGLCYKVQIIDKIEASEEDVKMDCIICEDFKI